MPLSGEEVRAMSFDRCLEHYQSMLKYRVESLISGNPNFGLTIDEALQEARFALQKTHERAQTAVIKNFDGYLFFAVRNRVSDAASSVRCRTEKQNDLIKQDFTRDALWPEEATERDMQGLEYKSLVGAIEHSVPKHDKPILEFLLNPPSRQFCVGCLKKYCSRICNIATRLGRSKRSISNSIKRVRVKALPVLKPTKAPPVNTTMITADDIRSTILNQTGEFCIGDVRSAIKATFPNRKMMNGNKIANVLSLMKNRCLLKVVRPPAGRGGAVFINI